MRIFIALAIVLLASSARAELPRCGVRGGSEVQLRAEPEALQALVEQLAAGLRASGIGVCASDEGAPIARIEIRGAHDAEPTVLVDDNVTHKRLERRLELAGVPLDGRSVAIALYVEELLQVSWAELVLDTPVAAVRAPVEAPVEVQRELEQALPVQRARPLRLAIGATLARYRGGLVQTGPSLGVGYRVRAWLEASVRFAYRLPARTFARNGYIDTQSLAGGVQLTPRLRLPAGVSFVFPQGLEVISATFLAHAEGDAIARSAVRVAVRIQHGAGLSVELSRSFSICALGFVSWTALPAEASEDGRVVVGIAGVGGEGELTFAAHF